MTADIAGQGRQRGNDLSSPVPDFGFPGLKPGDRVGEPAIHRNGFIPPAPNRAEPPLADLPSMLHRENVCINIAEIEANIEHTRFPVPQEEQHEPTDDLPGLLRAADLIEQLADINYLRKTAALFNEFRETGMNNKLKYNSAADLRAKLSRFFLENRPTLYCTCVTFESRKRDNSGSPTCSGRYFLWPSRARPDRSQ